VSRATSPNLQDPQTAQKPIVLKIPTRCSSTLQVFGAGGHNSFAGSDSAFDPHDLWEDNANATPPPSISHSHKELI
jgi:hypothetical protein